MNDPDSGGRASSPIRAERTSKQSNTTTNHETLEHSDDITSFGHEAIEPNSTVLLTTESSESEPNINSRNVDIQTSSPSPTPEKRLKILNEKSYPDKCENEGVFGDPTLQNCDSKGKLINEPENVNNTTNTGHGNLKGSSQHLTTERRPDTAPLPDSSNRLMKLISTQSDLNKYKISEKRNTYRHVQTTEDVKQNYVLETEYNELVQNYEKIKNELEKRQEDDKNYQFFRKENQDLKEQLENLNNDKQSLDEKLETLSIEARNEKDQMKIEIEKLQKEYKNCNACQGQCKICEKKLESMKHEKQLLQDDIFQSSAKADIKIADLEQKNTSLQEKLGKENAENQSLIKQMTDENEFMNEKNKSEITSLKESLENKSKESDHLKQELEFKNNTLRQCMQLCADALQVPVTTTTQSSENPASFIPADYHKNGNFVQLSKEKEVNMLNKLQEYHEKHNRVVKALRETVQELELSKANCDTLHEAVVHLTSENETLSKKLHAQQEQITDLSKRLAAEMSAKVSSNETFTENVSIKNRPMNVADEYSVICGHQWLLAKEEMDSTSANEEDKLKFLCDILMFSSNAAEFYIEDFKKELTILMQNPLNNDVVLQRTSERSGVGRGYTVKYPPLHNTATGTLSQKTFRDSTSVSTKSTIPVSVTNAVGDFLRVSCDTADVSQIVEQIKQDMSKKHPLIYGGIRHVVQSNSALSQYIKVCALLSWKMVVQRPPMRFSCDGVNERYDPNKQDINWGSDDPSISKVSCYSYPILYHNQVVMTKGRVFLKDTSFPPLHTNTLGSGRY